MENRYEIERDGFNSRISEIQAAALRLMLPRLDDWNAARASLAQRYLDAFAGDDSIALPVTPRWAEPVWHLFAIGHPDRDACARALAEREIGTLVHYPVLPHSAPPYRERFSPGDFPVAERLAAATLSLPLYPQLDPAACKRVATAVLETVESPASA